jgi:hypothetical protein
MHREAGESVDQKWQVDQSKKLAGIFPMLRFGKMERFQSGETPLGKPVSQLGG